LRLTKKKEFTLYFFSKEKKKKEKKKCVIFFIVMLPFLNSFYLYIYILKVFIAASQEYMVTHIGYGRR